MNMKKLASLMLALVLVLAMAVPAMAEDNGSITITNASNGETYSAYQMLDFTPADDSGNYGVYTVATGWEGFFTGTGADFFDVRALDGTVTIKEDVDLSALANAAIAYVKENNVTATDSVAATGSEVTISNLPLGYYVVDTTMGTICALTNTNSDVTAIEKNAGPGLEKKIVENDATVDANTVKIGDTVTYQATITIGKGVYGYVMHDKMSSGLTYTAVTSVTINGVDVDAANYEVITDVEDDCTFEIEFDDDYTATLASGTEIVVTYTAVVNENAVVGSTGNPNEAKLEYNAGNETESDNRWTPEDIVITYTTKLTVNKTDEENNALEGAGFTLYKKVGEDWKVVSEITNVTTFEWNGLDEGTYKIVETTVPAGYNKAEDIEFVITAEVPETVEEATDPATWTSNNALVTVENGTYNTTVVNKTGTQLPETGGMGTTLLYVGGGILVLGAVIVLITKKRMTAR